MTHHDGMDNVPAGWLSPIGHKPSRDPSRQDKMQTPRSVVSYLKVGLDCGDCDRDSLERRSLS